MSHHYADLTSAFPTVVVGLRKPSFWSATRGRHT